MEKKNQEVSSADVQELSYQLSGNLEEYLGRFEQIEEGKNRFNFSAAFFQHLWMAYQFMFFDWLIICFIGLILKLVLIIWGLYHTGSMKGAILNYLWIWLFFWLIKFIILGRFGDRLLYRNIKNRIKNNRKGKVSLITWLTSSDKTLVFRGTAVVVCEIIGLVLLNDVLAILIDWIVY
ncbi:hypothetical protein DS742_27490 [Lacrimispora amygdalina]|uniref:DUF2628 domain-containing protein n=1 Tax=Lacrimispora amygdalina TaxID=253257 RepID=A0A3E2N3Z1_9FIRM|nr:hypothetical protein [Clostridium indicum]RFZ75720.1 hypothetical protein DS742_27490 [Clostridium indicum]